MNRLKSIKREKEKTIIWKKLRYYIDFWILACCLIVVFNIHPTKNFNNDSDTEEKQKMIYIFHDFDWNQYILNDDIHGSANSLDYLFDKEIPNSIKWEESTTYTDSVSLWNKKEDNKGDSSIKDNQVSLEKIISDLWMDSDLDVEEDDYLIISLWNNSQSEDKILYAIQEEPEDSSLIIERMPTTNDETNTVKENNIEISENSENLPVWKSFTYISDWRITPILIPWDELKFTESYNNNLAYNNDSENNNKLDWYTIQGSNGKKNGWITIIDDYADCMTPRWYKIVHWDSILAYKQLDNAPDICNIERRYCWNWKLSWTYTQQWCSINKNYTYELRWESETPKQSKEEIKWWARQNPNWTVTLKNNEIWWGFVLEKPNRRTTEYSYSDNLRIEEDWVEQTNRPYRDCTAPRWETIKHGQIIQAFKHANWFSDAPCEAQFRLCSMWELMWTYSESTCQTRDTSFIDWINGSPTRKTYSKEKLELIKKKIKNEEKYYNDIRKDTDRATNSDALDKILYILDQD